VNNIIINNMADFINYLSEVTNSNRDIDASTEWLTQEVERFGGTVVLDCRDYGGDHVVMFSVEKHYPDTYIENRYVTLQITSDNYLADIKQGTFGECFDCLAEWTRTEVASVA
jgi:hypothetical protein